MIRVGIFVVLTYLCISSVSGQSWSELEVEETPIFHHTVNDTLQFPVYLVQVADDEELLFGTQLETNVCNDQVCLPIEVNLYWDLLGNYHHFSREDGVEFTKFDHDFFLQQDYERLQEILLDSLSALRDYQVEDLLDKEPQKFSFQVDAVTRPTSPLFSNVTVPGALYTVYTLWHIVNGSIKQALYDYTNENYRKRDWMRYFAKSKVPIYQEYFLKHLNPGELDHYKEAVQQLLFAQDDFIPHYAIDVLATAVLKNPDAYNDILRRLGDMKPHVVSEIISTIEKPNTETVQILSAFSGSPNASPKHKEIIEKILNYEKQ